MCPARRMHPPQQDGTACKGSVVAGPTASVTYGVKLAPEDARHGFYALPGTGLGSLAR